MQALPDRWVIATAGSVVMLLIGTVYSWAIFTQPLIIGFGWDVTTTTWPYAIANFCLAGVALWGPATCALRRRTRICQAGHWQWLAK